MRYLSKKQKNIIKDYINNGFFNNDLLIEKYGNEAILFKQLEKANDYETLYSDYKRLKSDLLFINTNDEKITYLYNFR